MEPVFLSLTEIIEIHLDQIRRYGGDPTVRDMGLLKSATAAAKSTFDGHYLHADLFEMAAAYMFHIVQNHPFVDGNKRTGATAALVFLLLNGIELDMSESEFEALVWSTARGETDKPLIAAFFRGHSRS